MDIAYAMDGLEHFQKLPGWLSQLGLVQVAIIGGLQDLLEGWLVHLLGHQVVLLVLLEVSRVSYDMPLDLGIAA